MVYLDHNATTPLRGYVRSKMLEAMDWFGNPSSVHFAGRRARGLVEEAREFVGSAFDVPNTGVIFTSGATESNNMLLKSMEQAGYEILFSAIEHPAVSQACTNGKAIPVDGNGVVDLESLEKMLAASDTPKVVAVMYANNEIGTRQPIDDVAKIARKYGAHIHCDAVQGLGKYDLSGYDVDSLAVSSHKIGGPKGAGALILKNGTKVSPLMQGGSQERGYRAGTENVAGIAGFGAAVQASRDDDWAGVEALRDAMEQRIQSICPSAVIHAKAVKRLPNTSYICMPGVDNQIQLMNFDLEGICVSTGSACGSSKLKASETLKAMGAPEEERTTGIRISAGPETTEEDFGQLVSAWQKLYETRCSLDRTAT
ncbi:MAG: cysteine desulfurase family protein [Alphaproteobacteria bacterium]